MSHSSHLQIYFDIQRPQNRFGHLRQSDQMIPHSPFVVVEFGKKAFVRHQPAPDAVLASLLHNQRVGGFVNLVFLVNLVILVKQVILIKLVISDKSCDSGNSGETCQSGESCDSGDYG